MTEKDKHNLKFSIQRLPVLYVEEDRLIEYLSSSGKGSNSTDYELAAAVWVCRLFAQARSTRHCVAFQLDDELGKVVPGFRGNSIIDISKALQKRTTDTPYDFFIAEGAATERPITGLAFQIKRFGKGVTKDFQVSFIRYIQSVLDKYSPGESGLILIPEIDDIKDEEERNALEVTGMTSEAFQDLSINKTSFKKVFILGKTSSEVYLSEIATGDLELRVPVP